MLKFILLIFLFSLSNQVYANNKNQIINKLENKFRDFMSKFGYD
mgnify:CR=1 FL=1